MNAKINYETMCVKAENNIKSLLKMRQEDSKRLEMYNKGLNIFSFSRKNSLNNPIKMLYKYSETITKWDILVFPLRIHFAWINAFGNYISVCFTRVPLKWWHV